MQTRSKLTQRTSGQDCASLLTRIYDKTNNISNTWLGNEYPAVGRAAFGVHRDPTLTILPPLYK